MFDPPPGTALAWASAMTSLFGPFQEVVGELGRDFVMKPLGMAGQLASRIRVDLDEDETAYTVRAEIPGARKEDIHVSAEGSELVLTAEIRPETHGAAGQRSVYSERSYGRASRSLTLPGEVDAQSASAQYRDGILTLVLPKKSALSGTRVPIS